MKEQGKHKNRLNSNTEERKKKKLFSKNSAKTSLSKEDEDYINQKFGNIELSESEASITDKEVDDNSNLKGAIEQEPEKTHPRTIISDPNESGYENPNKNALLEGQQEIRRSEKEKLQRIQAKKHYLEAIASGKTEQSKKDLKRLEEVRRKRELDFQLRQEKINKNAQKNNSIEEVEEKKKENEEKSEKEELTKIKIKKMNPQKIKEELKKLGLSTQGQKSEIMTRLLEAYSLK